jgi:DNA primase
VIKPDTIAEIFDTARIDDVIGDFVNLRKRGVNLLGLCPFHNEKTPSFTVSPAKGIFKCFGCGKGGNVVNFLMEHEHYTYPEALRYLAKKYNIEIDEDEPTADELEALNEKESLYHITEYAQKYYSEQLLNTEEGKAIGLSYFKERGFTDATIEKFQLGYGPKAWDSFTKKARDNGYKLEFLEKTGLTISKEDKQYDRFRSRVIFPIHNLSGRVIGFGGRILGTEENKPKYVNSPESEIYNKSKVLYGIFQARNSVAKNDNCLLVEGYTDVITLSQSGIENVVASSGTSLTVDQIKLIKRYTQNVTILYDGDPSGIKASFRGIDMILEEGMNVKIVLFPDGEDPDSFARKTSSAELEKFLTASASNFITFKTDLLLKEANNDPVKIASLVKEIVNTIALIPDGIFRTVYIKECSSLMNIPEQTLMNELNKILRKRVSKKFNEKPDDIIPESTEYTAEKQIEIDPNDLEYQERDIIRLLLLYGSSELEYTEEKGQGEEEQVVTRVAELIVEDLKKDDISFQNPVLQAVFSEFVEALEKEVVLPDEKYFCRHEDEEISKCCIDLVSTPYVLSEKWRDTYRVDVKREDQNLNNAVSGALLSFKSKKVDQMILEIQEKIKENDDESEIIRLLEELQKYKTAGQVINGRLGRVITK